MAAKDTGADGFATICLIIFVIVVLGMIFLPGGIRDYPQYYAHRYVKALERYVAKTGDGEALLELAYIYATGETFSGYFNPDFAEKEDALIIKFSVDNSARLDRPIKWRWTAYSRLQEAAGAGSLKARALIASIKESNGEASAWDDWRELAELGVPKALVALGKGYLNGVETLHSSRKPKVAARYFKRAAAQGAQEGEYWLAHCYQNGLGVERDPKRASELYERAILQGSLEATYALGTMLLSSDGNETDRARGAQLLCVASARYHKEATSALVSAAEDGNPDALNFVGALCAQGRGLRKDASSRAYGKGDVETLWKQAAALGNVPATINLGGYYEIYNKLDEAEKSYNEALEKGDLRAAVRLGALYLTPEYRETHGKRAVELLRNALDAGYSEAPMFLGSLYAESERSDLEIDAFELFKLASEGGDADAMVKLSECYELGRGTSVDLDAAAKWLTQSFFATVKASRKIFDQDVLAKRVMIIHFGPPGVPLIECAEQYGERVVGKLLAIAKKSKSELTAREAGLGFLRAKAYAHFFGTSEDVSRSLATGNITRLLAQGGGQALAELGNLEAIDPLTCTSTRSNVSFSIDPAAEAYRASAGRGDANGMYLLGNCYRYGLGRDFNDSEAAKLYESASERGNVEAALELAKFYYSGRGVPQDKVKAREYAKKAADAGSREAREWLEYYGCDSNA